MDRLELPQTTNIRAGSALAEQRAANGASDPFNVPMWCLGNERVPSEIEPVRPPFAQADAVLPPVAGNKVATRVADGGCAEVLNE
jgi:hypothetical protein